MNMSFDGGDPLVTSIGLCVLIGATWIGSYFSRQWSPAQGLLVAATGFGVVIVMTLHHANLDDQIERISDGRLAPADAFSFWLFAVPAVVLFVLSWLRLKNWSARRA